MVFPRKVNGFSLIELVITVAIFAIIASIAVPSYTQFVLKGNRADAKEMLLRVAQEQERFFYTTGALPGGPVYTADLTDLGYDAANPVSDEGYYRIVANVDNVNNSFTLTATAIGSQEKDERCATITLFSTGRKDSTSGANCW